MPIKTHTIGKYGIAFGEYESSFDYFDVAYNSVIYQGEIEKLPMEIAEEMAEIHPGFQKYYEMAMMPLYKTYSHKRGTENPILAIKSLLTKKEALLNPSYVIIWKIIEEDKNKLTNDQLGELLPAHQTMKLEKGWMAEVNYNHHSVKIGSRTKPKYNFFRVSECKTEREARQKIYTHLKKKKVL